MSFVVSDADRAAGVIYLDATRQDLASTHALVIGVGQYASDRLSPLGSPPRAARNMAEWFVDGMAEARPGSFNNPEKPLGSLGLLLSELPAGECSEFAGSRVPRATFDNAKKAVKAWIARAHSHPDNFLFLFISSHGESFGRRTAFLLEDYGTDDDDVTAGMSEIEQFVEALANVDASQQLLIFDCCRTPTSLGLKYDQQFGTSLINPPTKTDGRIRRAHVLRSTGLGFEAFGRKDGPTIFAQVLLDALRGLAASSSDNWTVGNFALAHTVARVLDLHERNGESLQMPDSQLNAPFVISAVPPSETATVFVSLGPQHDFSTCSFRLDDQAVQRDAKSGRTTPFIRLELAKYLPRKIAALDAAGQLIGETRIEPVPPVAFRELPELFKTSRAAGRKSFNTRIKGFAAASERGQLSLSFAKAAKTSSSAGLTAVIRPSGRPTAAPVTAVLSADGRSAAVSLEPGRYDIRVDGPDGRTLFSTVDIAAGSTAEVTLQPQEPDVRGVPPADTLEALATETAARPGGSARMAASMNWLRRLGVAEERIVAGGWPGVAILAAPVSPAFRRILDGDSEIDGGASDPKLVALVVKSPGLFRVEDRMPQRLPQRIDAAPVQPEPEDSPVWVAATGGGWREIAAVPSLGVKGKFQNDAAGDRDSWVPTVTVDPTPRAAASHVGAVVETRQWSGLLNFLARRDFELSAAVLEDLVVDRGIRNRDIRNALLLRVENPVAAAAGALVAVATGRLAQLTLPEQWLRNLTMWFPQLPDVSVILARDLMLRRGTGRAEVRAHLLEAYRRGIPLFSLSVDWLAQGLADFADDPEIAGPARVMRRAAQLCDPTRAFTVLRFPVEEDRLP